MDLVQKYIVHDSDEASPLLPMHVALVNEDGSEFGGGAAASPDSAFQGRSREEDVWRHPACGKRD